MGNALKPFKEWTDDDLKNVNVLSNHLYYIQMLNFFYKSLQ